MIDEEADPQTLRHEIAGLEKRLRDAKAALKRKTAVFKELENGDPASPGDGDGDDKEAPPPPPPPFLHLPPSNHALLLLSDSALPLGSFAFSSGLESYLSHTTTTTTTTTTSSPPQPTPPRAAATSLHRFLHLSLASLAASSLPYALAAYRHPARLDALDDEFDAATPCAVARRASVGLGRALVGVWERAFRGGVAVGGGDAAGAVLDAFRSRLRGAGRGEGGGAVVNGHFPPLWGCVGRAMGLSLPQTAYVFLFNHVKAVLSAGVRASVVGPYQAHGVLASPWVQGSVRDAMERGWNIEVEDAGQVVPVLDLYQGRHELLYSRIFNS
ncbi:hypothetical protein FGG08_005159 [Glutinoglossum americanum]|uniref:Urease accessory protein UreF n=1 Tax=Glutinoglossum americanum TaxID=1670608 RepID=A0A9P8IA04_9PEZI|nr:hypothetical protein FGG08_005159 [Glutinoglossum americanum]